MRKIIDSIFDNTAMRDSITVTLQLAMFGMGAGPHSGFVFLLAIEHAGTMEQPPVSNPTPSR